MAQRAYQATWAAMEGIPSVTPLRTAASAMRTVSSTHLARHERGRAIRREGGGTEGVKGSGMEQEGGGML